MANITYTSEIHRLLKLGPDLSEPIQEEAVEEIVPIAFTETIADDPAVPFNLPIGSPEDLIPRFQSLVEPEDLPTFLTPPKELKLPSVKPAQVKTNDGSAAKSSWASYLVYPLVFVLAFGFFYVVLNIGALTAQVSGWFAKSEEEVILQEDLTAYNTWINGYFFAVGDKEQLEANNDVDNDGLTNLDEFTVRTNPTDPDSDSDGISDGIEFINGTNPWGTGQMSKKQKEMFEKVDFIKINNRISLNASVSASNQMGQQSEDFDTTKPGRLSIPKLNIQVPIIWTQNPAEFDNDLTRGTVHYPGTALPGETGMVYISGHSSDYFWKNHPYKQVFAKINALEPGDDIFVDVYGEDGKIYNYRYKVTEKNIYAPDDQRQFLDNSGVKLNLSTCWPIGTQKDRYVVTSVLEPL